MSRGGCDVREAFLVLVAQIRESAWLRVWSRDLAAREKSWVRRGQRLSQEKCNALIEAVTQIWDRSFHAHVVTRASAVALERYARPFPSDARFAASLPP